MGYKKRVVAKKFDKLIMIFTVSIIILGLLLFKKPSITGRVVQYSESVFSENLNLEVNKSGTYEWNLKNPGNIKSLKASGSVSTNGIARVYIEKNGTRQLLFDSSKQLFDVNINVLPEYKNIFQGEKILIQNVLFNLRGFGTGDVNVRYSVKDSKGNVLATEEEKVYIETQAKFIRGLVIPAEMKAGHYVAFVEAFVNGTVVGTGSDSFEVKAKYKPQYPPDLRYYTLGTAVVVIAIIVIVLGIYGINTVKKKKAIAELKQKIPLEERERLKQELSALEDARKPGLVSEEYYQTERKRIKERLGVIKKL